MDYQIKSFEELFNFCECIESVKFKKFYRNNITKMPCMFYGCSSLEELNICNFLYGKYVLWMFIIKRIKSFQS